MEPIRLVVTSNDPDAKIVAALAQLRQSRDALTVVLLESIQQAAEQAMRHFVEESPVSMEQRKYLALREFGRRVRFDLSHLDGILTQF